MKTCAERLLAALAVAIAIAILAMPGPVEAEEWFQRAVVYFEVHCVNQNNGTPDLRVGSGVIVDQRGTVLSVAHVFECLARDGVEYKRKGFSARQGRKDGPLLELDLLDKRYKEAGQPGAIDVAILRFTGPDEPKDFLRACLVDEVKPQSGFWSYGFPLGGPYQPVNGTFGAPTDDGQFWSAASVFDYGMSGGPVVVGDRVIGLVKGGAQNAPAVRTVQPLIRGKEIFAQQGLNLKLCSEDIPPSGPVKFVVHFDPAPSTQDPTETRKYTNTVQNFTESMLRNALPLKEGSFDYVQGIREDDIKNVMRVKCINEYTLFGSEYSIFNQSQDKLLDAIGACPPLLNLIIADISIGKDVVGNGVILGYVVRRLRRDGTVARIALDDPIMLEGDKPDYGKLARKLLSQLDENGFVSLPVEHVYLDCFLPDFDEMSGGARNPLREEALNLMPLANKHPSLGGARHWYPAPLAGCYDLVRPDLMMMERAAMFFQDTFNRMQLFLNVTLSGKNDSDENMKVYVSAARRWSDRVPIVNGSRIADVDAPQCATAAQDAEKERLCRLLPLLEDGLRRNRLIAPAPAQGQGQR